MKNAQSLEVELGISTAVNAAVMARPWCDGGAGALGHPRVYLAYSGKNYTECPYCSRRFVTLAPEKH